MGKEASEGENRQGVAEEETDVVGLSWVPPDTKSCPWALRAVAAC